MRSYSSRSTNCTTFTALMVALATTLLRWSGNVTSLFWRRWKGLFWLELDTSCGILSVLKDGGYSRDINWVNRLFFLNCVRQTKFFSRIRDFKTFPQNGKNRKNIGHIVPGLKILAAHAKITFLLSSVLPHSAFTLWALRKP